MATQIKGLSQFIADLRSSATAEAEKERVQAELAALRKKLASAKDGGRDLGPKAKNGYEHRKVVSKLLYIYILGYDVDIGTSEMLALVRMPKFAEKQVGYLALSLLFDSRPDLYETMEPQLVEDLRSPKESLTSVALNYMSTWDANVPIKRSLVDLVYQLMVSPTSSSAVAKKAALTYTHFFKGQPQLFLEDMEEWQSRVERVCAILSGSSLGVSTSVVSLLIQIAKIAPDSFGEMTISIVSHKLSDVFEEDVDGSQNYVYYGNPAPWLVAKLCRLLLLLPVPESHLYDLRRAIAPVLLACVEGLTKDLNPKGKTNQVSSSSNRHHHRHHHKRPSGYNAKSFVFFEALSLANKLQLSDWDYDLSLAALGLTKDFLSDRDITLRYAALQALQSFPTPQPGLPDNELLAQVMRLVKDRDISVRRQAIDTLYTLVDSESVENVAAELLNILNVSDLQIRPQMVARLAGLIERFATSHEWYFDTSLSLLVVGGAYAGEEIWQRLIQVVVNNQALHAYAVSRVYDAITSKKSPYQSESLVKVAAFVLGEYSSLYTGDPLDLFVALQDRINSTSWATKIMMFTAYTKLAARYPPLRSAVYETLHVYRNSPHIETQQRANEFLLLLKPENQELLPIMLEPMPPFGEDSSKNLFTKALRPQITSFTQPALRPEPVRMKSTSTVGSNGGGFVPHATGGSGKFVSPHPTGQSMSRQPLTAQGTAQSATQAITSQGTGTNKFPLSSNWEFGFKRMLTHSEAVLYQDAIIQVGCRYEFTSSKGFVKLYLKNISTFNVNSLMVQLNNPMSSDVLDIRLESPRNSGSTLYGGQAFEYLVHCDAKQPFALTPTCRITFLAGSLMEIGLKLPIVLERFMTPSVVTSAEFQQRWEQLGPQLEFQKSFRNSSTSTAQKNRESDSDILKGMQYGLVEGAHLPGVFGAGIIHTSSGGMFGTLIMVQPDTDRHNYKVTVRTTRKRIAAVVLANNIAQAYNL